MAGPDRTDQLAKPGIVPVDITAAQGQALFDPAKLAVEVAADFGLDSGRIGTGPDSICPSQAQLTFPDLGVRPAKKGLLRHRSKISGSPSNGTTVTIVPLP